MVKAKTSLDVAMVLESNAELIASTWEVAVSIKDGASVAIAEDGAASVKLESAVG